MTRPLTRLAAVLAIATTAMLASACSSPAPDAEPQPSKTADAAQTTAPEAESDPTPAPDAEAADAPECDTIISPTTAADFASLGWTALADVFRVASVEVPEGIQCTWGDFTTATDHVQIFGWAPITQAQAETAASELVAEGWTREEGPEGVYVTESGETAIAVDEDGYGLTYLFGDGWVKFADTKQGLVLVAWPQS
ncbi:hypothetical protein [Microbacterium sp. SS28]|uniref:hypothetical protein n=1 Tax=Microbacterium sp. SS28 TaxID=2919948 RepID=UPI001FA99B50|nr:hypothetical protein [Microbacterium sp. SS28]